MLQLLRNDSTNRIVSELVDKLDELERADDASSWEKARVYVEGFEQLRTDPEYADMRPHNIALDVNQRLGQDAHDRGKLLPRPSFRAHALKLHRMWPEVIAFESNNLLSYQHYSQIAVCSLPRSDKDLLRAEAERDQPTQDALRKTIRTAVDVHNGIHKPDFDLRCSNLWTFNNRDRKHHNDGYGGVHPELIANILYWFSEPGDIIIDPMAGSGVLADTLGKYKYFSEAYEAVGSGPRVALMSDAKPIDGKGIEKADATEALPFDRAVAKLAIIDPPYFRVADGKRYENLGNTLDEWLAAMRAIIGNVTPCLTPDGKIVVITDDLLRREEHVPIAYRISRLIDEAGLVPHTTVYNQTRNYITAISALQQAAAKKAKLIVNDCKVIQVARLPDGRCKRR
jgi:hypothetical protein